jgi:hypothetical protein
LPQVRRDVERAAQALGFYNISHTIEFSAADPCWSLQISVEPGSAVRFGRRTFNAHGIPRPSAMEKPFFGYGNGHRYPLRLWLANVSPAPSALALL